MTASQKAGRYPEVAVDSLTWLAAIDDRYVRKNISKIAAGRQNLC
jgi:hypothetical protein